MEHYNNVDMLLEEMKVRARVCRLNKFVAVRGENVGDIRGNVDIGDGHGSVVLVVFLGVDNGGEVRGKAVIMNRVVVREVASFPGGSLWVQRARA